jgi:phosphate transport system protein
MLRALRARTLAEAAGESAPRLLFTRGAHVVHVVDTGGPAPDRKVSGMRDIYHDELDEIGSGLVEMTRLVSAAIEQATGALLDADPRRAERVIAADAQVDALRRELEDRAFQMIARQQPVATDLRVLITTLHLVADLERMGDLAIHVAKIARLRAPESAVPDEARDVIAQMGEVARSLIGKVGDVIEGRDVSLAQAIEAEDDSMDALRRKLFTLVLSPRWAHGTEPAIDLTLLGRYYERFADHAVAIARRVIFVVTGQHPEARHNGIIAR